MSKQKSSFLSKCSDALKNINVVVGLGGLLVISVCISLTIGAVEISISEVVAILLEKISAGIIEGNFEDRQAIVLFNLRMPRVLLGGLVGMSLAVSGASMQGLFRNPLVEPGLVGVSSGAALFAILIMVFKLYLPFEFIDKLGTYMLPFGAFLGGMLVTFAVYRLAKMNNGTQVSILILAGVAINALIGAIIGLVVYSADDTQLRSFTFWSMGDLSGARWSDFYLAGPIMFVSSLYILKYAKDLDAMALGESEARYLGVDVERVKLIVVCLVALSVGAAVALSGIIGFIGLVVPHMVRTIFGASHKTVLTGSMLGGAALLILSDTVSRVIVSPSELPIGIVTSLLGAPFFIYLLRKAKNIA
ncbi:FecCD family ABC transporter permease [Sediminitomix flava]|uniref:Iron complex transport system permease protein n=1 Tax=Sediminitomix flava TaxID=379075 RepID=A0A315ZHM8_SEDFL|nr:iron ABC transporter permease [Sediminitomix flava]PWJ44308.1 iron complex transport system permease protein [Sediminitomix flava]